MSSDTFPIPQFSEDRKEILWKRSPEYPDKDGTFIIFTKCGEYSIARFFLNRWNIKGGKSININKVLAWAEIFGPKYNEKEVSFKSQDLL
jgi:hypothetical protein